MAKRKNYNPHQITKTESQAFQMPADPKIGQKFIIRHYRNHALKATQPLIAFVKAGQQIVFNPAETAMLLQACLFAASKTPDANERAIFQSLVKKIVSNDKPEAAEYGKQTSVQFQDDKIEFVQSTN